MEQVRDHATLAIFLVIAAISAAILWYIARARAGRELFLRRIPGLGAVDDAVGRSTEMGRPVLFSLGLGGLNVITFAGLAVLQYVAKATAQFRARIIVPVAEAQVFPVVREVCRDTYQAAGHDQEVGWDDVRYLSGGQFAWAMAVAGLMNRERVGSVFYFGSHAAESLLLAETAHHAGAIQVAAVPSDSLPQIPFFIAACDYTIFGEEFYAASAYLSREPVMVGSLRGQDVGKLILGGIVALGALWATIVQLAQEWLPKLLGPLGF